MNLKRFLASSISAVMLFSGIVANAELVVVDDADLGGKVATSIPTTDEIKARTPELSFEVSKIETQADVKSATSAAWSLKHKVENFDVYSVKFNFTNLGGLYNGYDSEYNNIAAGVGLAKVALPLTETATLEEANVFVNSAAIAGGTLQTGIKDGSFNFQWATASTGNPYPYLDPNGEAVVEYMADGSLSIPAIIAVAKGSTVTFDTADAAHQFAYTVNYANTDVAVAKVQETLVLGEVPAAAELSIEATEVTNDSATNKGYAWKIDLTTGEADLAGFSADFTADGVTKTKNATGLPEIKGGADFTFYVALRLSSVDAIDSASFTVTDTADATDTATWKAE